MREKVCTSTSSHRRIASAHACIAVALVVQAALDAVDCEIAHHTRAFIVVIIITSASFFTPFFSLSLFSLETIISCVGTQSHSHRTICTDSVSAMIDEAVQDSAPTVASLPVSKTHSIQFTTPQFDRLSRAFVLHSYQHFKCSLAHLRIGPSTRCGTR